MKKLIIGIITVSLLSFNSFGAICRYCQGSKYRNISETCTKCDGKGVIDDYVTCPKCGKGQTITKIVNKYNKFGDYVGHIQVVYGMGEIKKRVPCDMCPSIKKTKKSNKKYKMFQMSRNTLERLLTNEVITNGVYILKMKSEEEISCED